MNPKSIEYKELILLVNTAFYLYEAADMCVREVDRRLSGFAGVGFKFETKRKFNNIKDAVKKLNFYCESFLDEYNEAYGDERIAQGTENTRKNASLFLRLALLIGDRCDQDDGTKEELIYQFIETMQSKGFLKESTLEKLNLKL